MEKYLKIVYYCVITLRVSHSFKIGWLPTADEGINVNTRIFCATDVHGSDTVFRKFVNAGKFYKANVVILNGDLTGKAIIPMVEKVPNTVEAMILGVRQNATGITEVKKLKSKIANLGFYPYMTTEQELEELNADSKKVSEIFESIMIKTMGQWINLLEQNLKDTDIKCFILPGNDDAPDIDKPIQESEYLINPEGMVVDLDENHEMINTGYSNPTPWDTPREESEEALRKRIEAMVSRVENLQSCIFNLHAPPYNSGLDTAPKLDKNLKHVSMAGEVVMDAVGSTAVRESIEAHQPLVGLHGHIHESKGARKIKRTLCLNPGSEYQSGVLKGVLLNLDRKKLKSYLFTSG